MNAKLLTIDEVRDLLADRCDQAGSQAALAAELGVGRAYINSVLLGRSPPSRTLCEALGIREDGRRWVRL
jgi:transcriptional regulator with XRE-family HTH domain